MGFILGGRSLSDWNALRIGLGICGAGLLLRACFYDACFLP